MEGLRFSQEGGTPRSPRGRTVLLVLLPTAFLGAAYFLFIEYTLRDALPAGSDLRLLLRAGGGALVLLSLVLAAGIGSSVVGRFLRPLRLLLRQAELGEMTPGRAPWLESHAQEYHELYRLLSVHISQNKAGARAMEELDQLRHALARFREELARPGQHGIPAAITADGPLRDAGGILQVRREHLLAFFADLRERVRRLHDEVEALGRAAGWDLAASEAGGARAEAVAGGAAAAPTSAVAATAAPAARAPRGGAAGAAADDPLVARNNDLEASVERLRRLGTILALEAARAAGAPGQRAAELLLSFQQGLFDLETLLAVLARNGHGNGGGRAEEPVPRGAAEAAGEEARASWLRLLETVGAIDRRLAEVEER